MKLRTLMTLFVLLSLLIQLAPVAAQPVAAQTILPDKGQVSSILYKVNKAWIDGNPDPGNARWNRAVYHIGNLAHYDITRDLRYYNYSNNWTRNIEWRTYTPCTSDNNGWASAPVDADEQAAGQAMFDLFRLDPNLGDWAISCFVESVKRSMVWAQFEVDLGSIQSINRVKFYPHNNRAYRYYVDVATTAGGPYTQVVNRHANTQQTTFNEDSFAAVQARYVRLMVVGATGFGGKDDENWVSIRETELFGSASPTVNLALNKAITCSSEPQAENGCKNVVDGNLSNRWSASFPLPDYMTGKRDSMNWWWIDAAFMAMPTYARFYTYYNDLRFAEMINVRYHYMRDEVGTANVHGLLDRTYGLWYRDARYISPTTTPYSKPIFWSRGNGWVFAALARTLQVLPPTAPYYAEYLADFKAMAAKVVAAQQPEGYWVSNLLHRADFPNGESSGTALFTYGLAWGINNSHITDASYRNAMNKGWAWLANTAVRSDGFLQYVQVEGSEPGNAPTSSTTDFGVGALLLAGSEVYKLAAEPATMATITVNSTADPGDGVCNSSECTLREAIRYLSPGGTINFALTLPATINLNAGQLMIDKVMTISGPGSSQLIIKAIGTGSNSSFRVLRTSGGPINISGLTLRDGGSKERGAGIYNTGTLTLKDVIVRDNYAYSYDVSPEGGGICNAEQAVLTLDNVTIHANQATMHGAGIANLDNASVYMQNTRITENYTDLFSGFAGGIYNASRGKFWIQIAPNGDWLPGSSLLYRNEAGGAAAIRSEGDLRMVHTRIEGNTSFNGSPAMMTGGYVSMVESVVTGNGTGENFGGALHNYGTFEFIRSLMVGNSAEKGTGGITNGGQMTIANSTIGTHYTGRDQGVIENGGTMTITNSTLNELRANPYRLEAGYGIRNHGTLKMGNSIIVNGTVNCFGSITSLGNNISSDNSCGFNAAGDLNNTDPKLNALADNGGPTQTYALAGGSPAIDSANNANCPNTDQRGLPRPSDGNGDGNAVCDRGAYEVQGVPTQARITIALETQPKNNLNFRFYGPFGSFTLDDPGAEDNDGVVNSIQYSVPTGSYNFTENKPVGWYLTEVRCDRPELATVNLAQFSVKLNVKTGDAVKCTFVNGASATVETFSYWDKNRNRYFDSGDVGQASWWSSLYDSMGKLKASNATDANGKWKVVNLRPGMYTVCQNSRTGWYNTQPSGLDPTFGNRPCQTFSVGAGGFATPSFGYSDQPIAASDEAATLTASEVEVSERAIVEEQEGFYTVEEFLAAYGGELPSEEEEGGKTYLPLIER